MKQWQNNWEKLIGNKLRQAETKPESHVWELLEMELNTQSSTKNNTYRIAAIVVILLLFATSYTYFTITPQSNEALFTNSLKVSPDHNMYNGAVLDQQGLSIKSDNTNHSFTVNESSSDNIPLADNSVSNWKKLVINAPRIERGIIADQHNINDKKLYKESYAHLYRKSVLDVLMTDEVTPLNVTAESISTSNITRFFDSYKTFEMGGQSELISNLILVHEANSLSPINSLIQAQSISGIQLGQLIENEQLLKDDLYTGSMDKLDVIPLDLQSILEDDLIDMDDGAAQHWLSGLEEEMSDWQQSISEENVIADIVPVDMDKEILEELIEEAELDKEDPLTIIKDEANRLYYTRSIHKGLHVGVVTGYQNTWVPKASRNPEFNRNYVEQLSAPGYQVGLNLGYDITKHFGIMAEIKYSDEGMRYKNPFTGQTEHLDLKYLEIPIYLKGKHSRPTAKMKPMVFNYLLGLSFSDLRKVESFVDGDLKRFAQDYNTAEWGITAGFDFDYYFNQNLFITVGTRGSVNTNASNFPRLSSDAEGTMNYSVGLFTRINFRLPGRQ